MTTHTLGSPGALSVLLTLVILAIGITTPVSAQGPIQVRWDEHHDHEAVTDMVEQWAEAYPHLVSVESIGQSVQGRELWLLTITNKETGAAEDKPALWFDANSDAPQVLTKEVALQFIDYLLTSYSTDDRVRRALDTRTLYILPNANPDPGEQLIQSPEPGVIQGISRDGYLLPWDEDGDGRADEDGPEDVNGDGLITSMRVEDPHGEWKVNPSIPMFMVRREPSDGPEAGPFYRVYETEGVDNDGDGRINEDWLGSWDSNRIYPANWQPEPRQLNAGPYPLYTPEPRAMVDAVIDRPNISAAISLHTSGPFPGGTLYAPPASEPPGNFPGFDVEYLYPAAGARFEQIMNSDPRFPHSCAVATNVYDQLQNPIFGTFIDWAYINRGIIAWTPEVWDNAFDYDGDCRVSPEERWRWSQEEWEGQQYVAWSGAEHSDLGAIEVGGRRNDYTGLGLLPPDGWADRASQMIPWFLHAFEMLPRVEITDLRVEELREGVHRVSATVTNMGFLPTSSTEHGATLVEEGGMETGTTTYVPYAPPVEATLRTDEAEIASESVVSVGHLRGRNAGRARTAVSRTWPNSAEVTWVVLGQPGQEITVRAGAPRAGFAEAVLRLE